MLAAQRPSFPGSTPTVRLEGGQLGRGPAAAAAQKGVAQFALLGCVQGARMAGGALGSKQSLACSGAVPKGQPPSRRGCSVWRRKAATQDETRQRQDRNSAAAAQGQGQPPARPPAAPARPPLSELFCRPKVSRPAGRVMFEGMEPRSRLLPKFTCGAGRNVLNVFAEGRMAGREAGIPRLRGPLFPLGGSAGSRHAVFFAPQATPGRGEDARRRSKLRTTARRSACKSRRPFSALQSPLERM